MQDRNSFFRKDQDLGRCGLSDVFAISSLHRIAALLRRRPAGDRPTYPEIAAVIIAHRFPSLFHLFYILRSSILKVRDHLRRYSR